VDLRGTLPTRPGAEPYAIRFPSSIKGVDIHYTASSPTTSVEGIAAFQTGPGAQEAFPAIAYTLVVDQERAHLCHDLQTRTWHSGAPGANTGRVSICWIGSHTPTAVQIDEMAHAHVWCERQLARELDVRGHRDAPYPTLCPGPTWDDWKTYLIRRIMEFR
jgi:hypothetical protein